MRGLGGLLLLALICAGPAAAGTISVGSKKFTESVILGEILAQDLGEAGLEVRHRRELGGTRVLWNALNNGDIDLYPEYTGTLLREILAREPEIRGRSLIEELALRGIGMSRPLGFDNSYALGMRETQAERLGIRRISDLLAHPTLVFGFGNEFMDREDGWPGLRAHYRLPQGDVRGLDHELAYRGLAAGDIDLTDLYRTDAQIQYYKLRVLEDDQAFFPAYQAIILYRLDLKQRAPHAVRVIEDLGGLIDERRMAGMNKQVKIDRLSESQVAADFLLQAKGIQHRVEERGLWQELGRRTLEHIRLVGLSLTAAILIAIPLGIAAWRAPRLGQLILGGSSIVQTIPALALLVFMLPLLGIGNPPAIAALFLYSLLPIIRNTYTGLHDIPAHLRESAEALGLGRGARLRLIELPLASRAILAGIKTSAVINVGTATLGALIGAGGYGQPILTGVRLDDMGLIMQGAIPAAALALLVQGLFELAERRLVPRGLRLKT